MRILFADDHELVREALAAYLRENGPAEVDTTPSLDTALDAVAENTEYDLVLLDYNMPGMQGLEGLRKMQDAAPDAAVAIISGEATRELAEASLDAGADGFIPKTLSTQSLMTAARFMISGEVYAPLDLLQSAKGGTGDVLTRREIQVLRGVSDGKSNKEIARDCDLQEVTVKLHVKTLSRKLGARNRTHAAMIGRDRGLV